jgi:hypothetical protein
MQRQCFLAEANAGERKLKITENKTRFELCRLKDQAVGCEGVSIGFVVKKESNDKEAMSDETICLRQRTAKSLCADPLFNGRKL